MSILIFGNGYSNLIASALNFAKISKIWRKANKLFNWFILSTVKGFCMESMTCLANGPLLLFSWYFYLHFLLAVSPGDFPSNRSTNEWMNNWLTKNRSKFRKSSHSVTNSQVPSTPFYFHCKIDLPAKLHQLQMINIFFLLLFPVTLLAADTDYRIYENNSTRQSPIEGVLMPRFLVDYNKNATFTNEQLFQVIKNLNWIWTFIWYFDQNHNFMKVIKLKLEAKKIVELKLRSFRTFCWDANSSSNSELIRINRVDIFNTDIVSFQW